MVGKFTLVKILRQAHFLLQILFKGARDYRGINNLFLVQTWQNTPSFFIQNVEVRILALDNRFFPRKQNAFDR